MSCLTKTIVKSPQKPNIFKITLAAIAAMHTKTEWWSRLKQNRPKTSQKMSSSMLVQRCRLPPRSHWAASVLRTIQIHPSRNYITATGDRTRFDQHDIIRKGIWRWRQWPMMRRPHIFWCISIYMYIRNFHTNDAFMRGASESPSHWLRWL